MAPFARRSTALCAAATQLSTRRSARLSALVIGSLLASVPLSASGQDRLGGGYDLRLFRPSVDTHGYIGVNGSEVQPHNRFSFGLTLDGGFGLLNYEGFLNDSATRAEDADRRGHIVDRLITGTLHVNYGLFDWLVFGVQMPLHLVSGPNLEVLDNTGAPLLNAGGAGSLATQSVGDLALHVKARYPTGPRAIWGLAGILQVTAPTGSASRFVGEPGVGLWPQLVGELIPANWFRAGVNVGYRMNTGSGATLPIGAETTPGDTSASSAQLVQGGRNQSYGDLVTFGTAAAFRVLRSLDLIAELYGTARTEGSLGTAVSMEALGGLKIFVQESSYLLLAGGAGLPPSDGFQRADGRAVFSVVYEPKRAQDLDGDGVPDELDACPEDAEDADEFEDEDGCPDADNDGDGILDVDDQCPETPESFNGVQDSDGCPERSDILDRDGDGIPDDEDACPDIPEDENGVEDLDGCPEGDRDQDGVLDVDDACLDDSEDFDGYEDDDGCPEQDNDRDRILDQDDACPLEPEIYNGFEDEDGCPDEGSVLIEDGALVILDKIYFRTNSADILARSEAILDAVGATLVGNPNIRRLEVQGHADERGRADHNFDLTRRRADSVVAALVERGVESHRIRGRGYGEVCPLDKRKTKAAYNKNRRVEFRILETDEGPALEPVACPEGLELYAEGSE